MFTTFKWTWSKKKKKIFKKLLDFLVLQNCPCVLHRYYICHVVVKEVKNVLKPHIVFYSNHCCSLCLSVLLQVVFSLTIPSTSHGPSLLLSFTWVPRISSLTSRGSRLFWILTLNLSRISGDTCFFCFLFFFSRPSERAIFLHRWRTHRSKTVFGLEDVVSPTDWEAQCSSLCFLLLSRPRFITSEGSNFTQSNTRILRETFGCDCAASMARAFGLSYSNTPELLSSSLLYLRRCECPIGVWPDTALQ